jgi:hypothetical protein
MSEPRLSPDVAALIARLDSSIAGIDSQLTRVERQRGQDVREFAEAFRKADFNGRYAIVAMILDDVPADFKIKLF